MRALRLAREAELQPPRRPPGPVTSRLRTASRWLAARRLAFEIVAIGALPIVFQFWLLVDVVPSEGLGYDLRYAYLPAAHDVLDGASPYPAPSDPALAGEYAYVYPPVVAYLMTPLTVVGALPAAAIGIACLTAALMATLWLLGIRDWRCYTIVFAWAPVYDGLTHASISVALTLLLALAWRFREGSWGGASLGAAIAVKLFLAPLLVWSVARRRGRFTLVAVISCAALVFVPWALIGFSGLGSYPTLLRSLVDLEQTESFSLVSAFAALGTSATLARVLAIGVALGLLAACYRAGGQGRERCSFTLAVLGALALSPIAWQHYWVVLIVPLALVRPRFSAIWLVPVAFWVGLIARDVDDARALSLLLVSVFGFVLVRLLSRVDAGEPNSAGSVSPGTAATAR